MYDNRSVNRNLGENKHKLQESGYNHGYENYHIFFPVQFRRNNDIYKENQKNSTKQTISDNSVNRKSDSSHIPVINTFFEFSLRKGKYMFKNWSQQNLHNIGNCHNVHDVIYNIPFICGKSVPTVFFRKYGKGKQDERHADVRNIISDNG